MNLSQLLNQHPNRVAKRIGFYRRIGRLLPAFAVRPLSQQEMPAVCRFLREESDRQAAIRAPRTANLQKHDFLSLRGPGFALANFRARKANEAYQVKAAAQAVYAAERAAEKAAKAAADLIERRRVFACLRKLGFIREHTSGKSAYYKRGPLTVRVSDHEVPETDERMNNRAAGGKTWANSRWSYLVGEDDLASWLEEINERIAQASGK